MTRTIVITSGKGGVGKTTSTSNIGMALARLGQKILITDADLGLRNLDLLLGLENRIMYTGTDVIEGRCRLEQTIIEDKREPNLSFFPLISSSSQTKTTIGRAELQSFVDSFNNEYDFILIDCPAGIDEGFEIAIQPAKEAIVVVTPEITSIRDADKVLARLEAKGINNIRLLINRVKPLMVQSNNMLSTDDIGKILGIPLIGVVPDNERIIIASNRGEPLVLDKNLTLPGLAYEHTAKRLIGEEVEFLDIEAPKNPIKKLFNKIKKNER